jgi:hypothetical protein
MANLDVYPKVIFPVGFDERAELEMPDKGWVQAVVELPGGSRFEVRFVDRANLIYDVEAEFRSGQRCFGEAGLIVVQAVTVEQVRNAAACLWRAGYFDELAPQRWPDGIGADSDVTSTARAIESYESLRPDRLSGVERLEVVQRRGEEEEMQVRVELRELDPAGDGRLLITFRGALLLRVSPTTKGVIDGMRLRVSPVDGRGWGALRYSVAEELFGTISFLCTYFEARIV